MHICVTGVSRGLGEALTRVLTRQGHQVWGVSRDEQKLKRLAQELPSSLFLWSRVDVGVAASIAAWGAAMQTQGFVPDAVVLNASVQIDDLGELYDGNVAEEVLRVNLIGALRCVELFVPLFQARRRGRIVAIASTSALRPSARSAAYAASKAGLAMAMRSLRLRYSAPDFLFKTVYLGPIATEMWGGKQAHWLVGSPSRAAQAIADFVFSGTSTLYYPFLSTLLLRSTSFLPDRVFSAATAALR